MDFPKEKKFRMPSLTFEDTNKDWLTQFDRFLAKTSPAVNARNIHFRNIRAVFNDAIDDDITTAYPFHRFKIRNVATRTFWDKCPLLNPQRELEDGIGRWIRFLIITVTGFAFHQKKS